MPQIDLNKVKNTRLEYTGPVIPNYNFSNAKYEKIGSSDTVIGKLFGNYYDKAFIPEASQTNQRYYNQGDVTGAINNVLKLASAVPAGFASLGNVAFSLTAATTGLIGGYNPKDTFLNSMENNPIAHLYQGYKGMVASSLPVPIRDEFNDSTFFQQLAHPGQLFSSSNESLQFLVEMFATSGSLAATGAGTRLANYLAKNKPLFKSLTKLQGPNVAKMAGRIDNVLANTALTSAEAFQEGQDFKAQAIEKMKYDRLSGLNNYTDEEIEKAAAAGAENVFWENVSTLAFTNGAFLSLVRPMFRNAAKMTRDNIMGIRFRNGKYGLPMNATEDATKFDKFLFDKGYTPGVVTKTLLSNVFSEGLEESLQYSIQKVNDLDGSVHGDQSTAGSFVKYLKSLPSAIDLSDEERLKAAGLGALIGGGQVAISSGLGYGPLKESREYREQRDQHISSLNSAYTDFVSANIYQKSPTKAGNLKVEPQPDGSVKYFNELDGKQSELNPQDFEAAATKYGVDPTKGGSYVIPGSIVMDSKGNPLKDPAKVAEFIKDVKMQGELDDYIEQETLKGNPDKLKLDLYKKQKLALLAAQAFKSGTTDLLLERFQNLQDAEPQELASMGIDPEEASTEIPRMTKYIEELEALWQTVNNSVVIASNSEKENADNALRRSFLYNTGSRMLTLDDMVRTVGTEYDRGLENIAAKYRPEDREAIVKTIDAIAKAHSTDEELAKLFNEKSSLEAQLLDEDMSQEIVQRRLKENDLEFKKLLRARLSTKHEEIPLFNKLSSDSEIQALAQMQNKVKYLSESREELGKTFDKALHTRSGFDYYRLHKNNRDTIDSYLDKGRDQLFVTEDLTNEAYQYYEDRMVSKLGFNERANRTSTEFLSEYVNEFVKWYDNNNNDPYGEGLESILKNLDQLVSNILDKSPRLYDETKTALKNKIFEAVDKVDQLVRPLEEQAKAKGMNSEEYIDLMYDNTPEGPALDALEDQVNQYYQGVRLREQLGNTYSQSKAVADKINALPSDQQPISTEDELRVKAAQKFLDPYSRILNSSAYDGDTISEEYTDEVSPAFELEKLSLLRDRILQQKGSQFNGVKQEYDKAIRDLRDILRLIRLNRANRELRNKMENAIYTTAFLGTAGIIYENGTHTLVDTPFSALLTEAIGKEKLTAIAVVGQQYPDVAVKAILDTVQNSPNKDEMLSELDNMIRERLDITASIFDGKYNVTSNFATGDLLVAFGNSPVRVFKHILDNIASRDRVEFGHADLALNKFLKDYNLVDFVNSRDKAKANFSDRNESGINNQDMDALISIYLELISINTMLYHGRGEISELAKMMDLKAYAEDQKKSQGKPTPSIAQERVIAELSSWVAAPASPTNYVGENIATLKAPPGAGKSVLITPLIMRLSGLEAEQVVTAATFAPAAENIANSVGSPTTNTLDTLITALNNNEIPTTTRLIIFDEAGPAPLLKLDELMRALRNYNSQTSRVPVKMLMIYDPNQVTSGYKRIPDIEDIGYNLPQEAVDGETTLAAKQGQYQLHDASNLVFTQHIYDATPLTASYRSDVAEIVDLFTKFGSSEDEVANVSAASSIDPRVDTKNIQGTYVETDTTNLVPILTKSVQANPARTKAVIVGTESRKELYKQELSKAGIPSQSVDVITVEEAQGLTFDEAYVDVRRTDSPSEFPGLFQQNFAYNRYMNTAISRASKFAYVANVIGTNQVDTSIPAKAAEAAKSKGVNHDDYITTKDLQINLLQSLVSDAVPTTITNNQSDDIEDNSTGEEVEEMVPVEEIEAPTPVEVPVAAVEPEFDEDTETLALTEDPEEFNNEEKSYDYRNPDAAPITIETLDNHISLTLEYPENYAFSDHVDGTPAVKPGDEVFIVRDTYNKDILGTQKERFVVVKQIGDGRYRKVAVLSDAEVRRMGNSNLKRAMGNLSPIKLSPESPTNNHIVVTAAATLSSNERLSMFLGGDSTGLTYRYSNSVAPDMQLKTPADLVSLFESWAFGMFGPQFRTKISNLNEILNEPEKYIYIKSFSSPKRLSNFYQGRKAPRILPKLGIPYVFIEGIKLHGQTEALAPQYIRTTSNILTKSTPLVQATDSDGKQVTLTTGTIKRFIDIVENFHKELEAHPDLGIYSTTRMGRPATDSNGKPIVDGNGNNFYPFHALVKVLSQRYQKASTNPIKIFGTNAAGEDTKGISEKIRNTFPDIPADKVSKKLLELAAKLDSLQHFGDEFAIQKGKAKLGQPRNFDGHAQLALNKLALNNFFVTLPDGTPMILRDYESNSVGGKMVESISGRRLMGPVTLARKNRAYNPLVKASIMNRLKGYVRSLEQRGLTDSARYGIAKDMIDREANFDIQAAPLTLEQLKQLIVNGAKVGGQYTNISSGFGLRAPSTFYTKVDDTTITNWNVGTNFAGVRPTNVTLVSTPPVIEEAEVVAPVRVETIEGLIQRQAVSDLTNEELVEQIDRTYGDNKKQAFITSMKASDLSTAVADYRRRANSTESVRKLSVTLDRTIRNLQGIMTAHDTDIQMLTELYSSDNYWKEDSKFKYGPRDTVRLAVLIRMFPELATSSQLTRIATYFAQNRWYRAEEITAYIQEYDKDEVAEKLTSLVDAATAVAKQYGIKVSPPEVVDPQTGAINVQLAVEYIAETVGSKVRRAESKQSDALPIELKEQPFSKKLAEAVYQDSDAVDLLRGNPEEAKALGLDLTKTDAELKDAAIKLVLENGVVPPRSMVRIAGEDIGELLNDKEARALYNKLLPKRNIPILSKIFRSKKGEAFRIINHSKMVSDFDKDNWGLYKDGIVYVARTLDGESVGEKVVRHEVMHKIIWEYLTPTDRAKFFELSRERFGEMDLVSLEERAVEAFMNREYEVPNGIWNSIIDVINKILRYIGFTVNNLRSLDAFFNSVESGLYATGTTNKTPSIERDMKIAKTWRVKDPQANPTGDFTPVESYILFEDIMFEVFNEVYNARKSRDKGMLVSFEEAIEETFVRLTDIHNDPEAYISDINPLQVKEALGPVLDPNGQGRRDVIKEYFPQTRRAEQLAVQLSDIRERYTGMLEQLEDIGFDSEEESAVVLRESLGELEAELNLKEELFESALRDPKDKLTGRVKQRFSSLRFLDKGEIKVAEFGKVFNIMLETIPQTSNDSLTQFVNGTINNLMSKYSPKEDAIFQNGVGNAVAKFMRDTARNLRTYMDKDKGRVYFQKDVNNYMEYVIIGLRNKSARGVTRTEALQKPTDYRVVDRADTESLHDFANRIEAMYPLLSYDEIRNAYYLYEELVFASGLVSSVASLRTNKPTVGITYYRFGMKSERYYPNKRSGPTYVLETDITTYFDVYMEGRLKQDADTLFDSEYMSSLPLPSDTDAVKKLEAVNQFLRTIKINTRRKVKSLGDTPLMADDFYFRFYHFINSLQQNYKTQPTAEDIARYGVSEYKTGAALISDESSVRTMLAEALNHTSSATTPTSYRRGDGKQAYRFVDASHQSRLLTYLENATRVAAVGKDITNVQKPDHLTVQRTKDGIVIRTESPLLKGNIYVNNNLPGARIRGYIDHDSMKTFGRDRWAKYLRAENPTDYDRRNFAFGFLAQMKKTSNGSYYQFLPIPSNRTTIEAVEVQYLQPPSIDLAVRQSVTAELTRPNPELIGLENNKAYVSSWEKITFPGVYSETGMQMNRKELLAAAKKAKMKPEDYALKLFKDHVQRSVDEVHSSFLSDFQGGELLVDEANLISVANRMKISTSNFVSLSDVRKANKAATQGKTEAKAAEATEAKHKEELERILKAVLTNFYGNYVVNQYSLSNLIYSDSVFYKSKEDETKRIQIATSNGDVGLIDELYGMPKESNVLVMEDIELGIPLELDYSRDDSFGETYKSTDGQGFVLPEFYEKMARAYSVESKLDITLKPVYFNVDEKGVPTALKYSLVVLTDELVKKFPHLSKLRDKMRNYRDTDGNSAPIHQAVFDSAVKLNNPKRLTKFDGDIDHASVLRINNAKLLIQLNPAKDTDGSNANPSQATAFMNTNGLNTVEVSKLHTLNASIIELGTKRVARELEISAKGGLSKSSLLAIRKRLINMTDDLPGADDINVLLSHKEEGEYAVSMDIPLLARRVSASLAAMVSRSSVAFRFPGSKFVLQAQAGTSENLKWKDADGYTEVILPDTYRRYFNKGEVITNGLVGFRIPSTNYHSLLALKVKDFYPTPKGSKGNIIIAPSPIVYYHGSDYDIDTLFVIRKGEHPDPTKVDMNEVLRRYLPNHKDSKHLEFEKGDVFGFKGNVENKIGNIPVHTYLENATTAIETKMQELRAKIRATKSGSEERQHLVGIIQNMEQDYYKVIDYAIKSSQNAVVHLFSVNLRDTKNRTDLLTPISFGRTSNVKSSIIKELEQEIDTYILALKKEGLIDKIKYCG